ncbi:Apc13p protein-domain-containing protein [Nemania sp. FL0916]|nr:Apc13p protein-domain-containing protein [Nemania sp. FL0916]
MRNAYDWLKTLAGKNIGIGFISLAELSPAQKYFARLQMQRPRDADLFEDFGKDKLPDDDIYVPAHHQPINPEDEDDVVPDQHAAFGIQKATQRSREPAWKDLDLAALMKKGPAPGRTGASSGIAGINPYKGLPR